MRDVLLPRCTCHCLCSLTCPLNGTHNRLQGAADADHPLVQELHALVNANKAEAAKRAFEAVLAPLEAQLAEVRWDAHEQGT